MDFQKLILFNIYGNNQPQTSDTQCFVYVDNLTLAAQETSFEQIEDSLTSALNALYKNYDANALRFTPSKIHCVRSISAVGRTLNPLWQSFSINHCPNLLYLGINLDRAVTYRRHRYNTKQKTRNNLLRCCTTSCRGTTANIRRTSRLLLSFAVREYTCPE